MASTEPIRKSSLPCTPPSEYEFHTVHGGQPGSAGVLLVPNDDSGPVVVRRRVIYGDWEPVRPDHWADEPEPDGDTCRPQGWKDWPEDRREALFTWLTANSIRPADVPIRGDLYIEPGPDGALHIHYEAFHLNSEGRKHLNERGNEVALEHRTAPLLVDPPDWWEPHRKPTRDQLLAATDRVRALHHRNENTDSCEHCSARDYPDYEVPFPCPTIQALDGTP